MLNTFHHFLKSGKFHYFHLFFLYSLLLDNRNVFLYPRKVFFNQGFLLQKNVQFLQVSHQPSLRPNFLQFRFLSTTNGNIQLYLRKTLNTAVTLSHSINEISKYLHFTRQDVPLLFQYVNLFLQFPKPTQVSRLPHLDISRQAPTVGCILNTR